VTDFVTRLERELVEAIEREQRSRRLVPVLRPRAPRRAIAVVAVAAAIAAAVLAIPRPQRDAEPQPAGPVPERLVGDYTSQRGRVALILDLDRYTLLLPRGERVVGPVGVEGDVLLLWDDGGGACDGLAYAARYRFRLADRELRLTRIEDPCAARAAPLTAGPLRRGG
jgi:hypothetical protein